MGYLVIIYMHHKVTELIEQGRFVLTTARTLQYGMILTYPDVKIQKCQTINPVNSIPFSFEGQPHDCMAVSLAYSKLRPDLKSSLITDADMTYFIDGSCFRDHVGNNAGFATVQSSSDGRKSSTAMFGTKGRVESFDTSMCTSHRKEGKYLHRFSICPWCVSSIWSSLETKGVSTGVSRKLMALQFNT